eukprot:2625411-Prorocentrum_lima.AAC.1
MMIRTPILIGVLIIIFHLTLILASVSIGAPIGRRVAFGRCRVASARDVHKIFAKWSRCRRRS